MKIVDLILHGSFTDGLAYQENCLPYYHKKSLNSDAVIISGPYILDPSSGMEYVAESGESVCADGIRLIRLSASKIQFISKKFAYYPKLYNALKMEKPDIIFVHLLQSFSLLSVRKYKKKHPEVKVYADSHADYVNSAHSWLSKKILHNIIWRMIIKWCEPFIDTIYGVLPLRVDFLKEMYKLPEKKVKLLLMGAEDEKIHFESADSVRCQIRNDLSIPPDNFVIITGGKIDRKKNIHILIKVLKKMNRDNIILIIFGSVNEEMKKFMEIAADYPFIRYIGWISSDAMYDYFLASDLAVFPGTHSVIWEQAVGTNLPCIFKRWEGITHIDRGGNAILIGDDIESDLEKAVSKVVSDADLYKKMRQKAKEIGTDFRYSIIAKLSVGFG